MPAAARRKGGGWLLPYERRGHELLPFRAFMRRMAFNISLGLGVAIASLLAGMWGYAYFEGMDTTDSFLNAAMILSGMGPETPMQTEAGKWFAGIYALFSGFAVLAVAGLVFAPLLHRLLHHFHADETDVNAPSPPPKKQSKR